MSKIPLRHRTLKERFEGLRFKSLRLKYTSTLRWKLLTLISLALLVPLLALAAWSYAFLTKANLNNTYLARLQQLSYIDLWLDAELNARQQEIMTLLANQETVRGANDSLRNYTQLPASTIISPEESALAKTFKVFKTAYPDITFLFMGLEDDSYVEYPEFAPKKPYAPTHRPWYLNTMVKKGIIRGNPYYTSVSNQLVVGITQGITTNSGLKGVIGYTMAIDTLTQRVHKNVSIDNMHFLLINPSGTIVVSPKSPNWISRSYQEVIPPKMLAHLRDDFSTDMAPLESKYFDFQYIGDDTVYMAIAHTLPNSQWRIVALEDKDALLKPTRLLMTIYLAVFGGSVIFSLWSVWRFIGRFTKPLEAIGHTINSENYLQPEGLNEIEAYRSATDEIGHITRAILQLIDNRRLIAENQERLAITTELTTQAHWDYITSESLLYLNTSMSRLFGLPLYMNLLSIDPILEKVEPQHAQLLRDGLRGLLSGHEDFFELAVRIHLGAQANRWFLVRAKAVQTTTSALPERIVGVLVDIDNQRQQIDSLEAYNAQLEHEVAIRTTDLTALNEELIATNDELESALAYIRDRQEDLIRSEKLHTMGIMVSGVAHEVNTPLGIAITLCSYLTDQNKAILKAFQEGQLSRGSFQEYLSTTGESLSSLHLNLQKTAGLIESLRAFNKESLSDAPTAFNVAETLDEVLMSLKPALENKGITLSTRMVGSPIFLGTPRHLDQILTNLLLNSIKHAFEQQLQPPHIAILLENDTKGLRIRYSDNGSGIPTEIAKHIFDPFFTTKRGAGGTGLGLYLVYNLVIANYGGAIDYEALHPHGSAFTIQLKPQSYS